MNDVDVYQYLKDDLYLEFGIDAKMASEIVSFLQNIGVLDYDTLKEVYLYGDGDLE